jgi:hypothetical protein
LDDGVAGADECLFAVVELQPDLAGEHHDVGKTRARRTKEQ